MGAGTGFANGMQNLTNLYLQSQQLNNQRDYYAAIGDLSKQQREYDLSKQLAKSEFERGRKSLPTAFEEEEQARHAAATRPAVPSSTPTVTPGPMGIPQTSFPVGAPVPPMPAEAASTPGEPPKPAGAMALIPGMRPRLPMMGRRPPMLRNFGLGRR